MPPETPTRACSMTPRAAQSSLEGGAEAKRLESVDTHEGFALNSGSFGLLCRSAHAVGHFSASRGDIEQPSRSIPPAASPWATSIRDLPIPTGTDSVSGVGTLA